DTSNQGNAMMTRASSSPHALLWIVLLRQRITSPQFPKASPHQDIAELPRIRRVDVFRKQTRPIGERRPVGVVALDGPEIRHLDFEAAAEINLVGLDAARLRGLQRPPQ